MEATVNSIQSHKMLFKKLKLRSKHFTVVFLTLDLYFIFLTLIHLIFLIDSYPLNFSQKHDCGVKISPVFGLAEE